jgi:hypothetical protein
MMEKRKALDLALLQIEKQFGKGSIMKMSESKHEVSNRPQARLGGGRPIIDELNGVMSRSPPGVKVRKEFLIRHQHNLRTLRHRLHRLKDRIQNDAAAERKERFRVVFRERIQPSSISSG